MRLPENPSKIVGKTYTGQKDDEGRPHGQCFSCVFIYLLFFAIISNQLANL